MQVWTKTIGWLIFGLICYFPLFLHLDMPPIKVWDESLFAMRAYYMTEEGAFLENFQSFPGQADYENLKPPLGTLIQALFFRLFGVSELSLRLLSSLAAIATFGLLLYISRKVSGHIWPGLIATLCLLCSTGYISPHMVRTGDQDVLTSLLMLSQMWLLFRFHESERSKYLYLFSFVALLTFLVKSVFALFWFPAFAIFLLLAGSPNRVFSLFKRSAFWGAALLLLGGIVGYYWTMNALYPGFWGHVLDSVLGRYVKVIDQHQHPFGFYFQHFWQSRFFPWAWLLLVAPLLHFRYERRVQQLHLLLWLCLLSHFLIISSSATKLIWYDGPVFALAALILGIAISHVLQLLGQRLSSNATLAKVAILGLMFAIPYYQVIQKIYHKKWTDTHDQFAYLMKKVAQEQPDIKDYVIYCGPYNGQVGFYTQYWNDTRSYNIKVADYWKDEMMHEGVYILSCYPEKLEAVRERYPVEIINRYEQCELVRLKGK
ncbi:MAG: glycosyltransferase family 39 protein [Saprospiraceae bacterium]|nr:glycosyltransferase family 39 protein [Saprospiraceae bacterium]